MKMKYNVPFIVGGTMTATVESFRRFSAIRCLFFPERLNGDYCSFIRYYSQTHFPTVFPIACRKMAKKNY